MIKKIIITGGCGDIGFATGKLFQEKEFEKSIYVKVRSTGKLIKAKVELNHKFANVNLLEDEYGISPGQACVFYSKNKIGDKVLGGGWIDSNYL